MSAKKVLSYLDGFSAPISHWSVYGNERHPMKSPIQRQLEIFSAALDYPPGPKRDEFVAEACGGDETLRRYVHALLAGHEKAGTFLDKAAGPVGPGGTHLVPITEKPGDKIGRYKLLQQIGEGGCGVVYMAEQEEPVRRRVALKVIKLGMDTKQVIARFEAERQALALMDHPNIAKIYDAGVTDGLVRSAGFQPVPTCCIADFESAGRAERTGRGDFGRAAGWKPCDTADWKSAVRNGASLNGAAVLCHGTGARHQDHGLLRREQSLH